MTPTADGRGAEPAEARAERVMTQVGGDVARFVTRAAARVREEVEDVVAEAQAIRHGDGPADRA